MSLGTNGLVQRARGRSHEPLLAVPRVSRSILRSFASSTTSSCQRSLVEAGLDLARWRAILSRRSCSSGWASWISRWRRPRSRRSARAITAHHAARSSRLDRDAETRAASTAEEESSTRWRPRSLRGSTICSSSAKRFQMKVERWARSSRFRTRPDLLTQPGVSRPRSSCCDGSHLSTVRALQWISVHLAEESSGLPRCGRARQQPRTGDATITPRQPQALPIGVHLTLDSYEHDIHSRLFPYNLQARPGRRRPQASARRNDIVNVWRRRAPLAHRRARARASRATRPPSRRRRLLRRRLRASTSTRARPRSAR